MFLLIGEGGGVYHALQGVASPDSLSGILAAQFRHHPWAGLWFWDLIQPFFMFIVGVAMPFSLRKRLQAQTVQAATGHIIWRCLMLLTLGVILHCVYSRKLVWELWNVLSQLSFTVLVTFLLLQKGRIWQGVASVMVLMLAEVLYRAFDPAQPFVKDANFGSYMDMVLMGKINNGGGWVTINCLSTTAHTLWGAICGLTLMNRDVTSGAKVRSLLRWGTLLLVVGLLLHFTGTTPIIKRIATTSFVLTTGGICLYVLAACYWLIDIRQKAGQMVWFFGLVGMNPIFIYLFTETVGKQWFNGFVQIFTEGMLGWVGAPAVWIPLITALVIWFALWGLCYWLYSRRIFFKI